jgi:uncharacterized protein
MDRDKIKAGEATLPEKLRKQFVAEVKAEADNSRVLGFTISTAAVDRQYDSIAVDGWDFAAYRKNPVVLWAHDYTILPVARSLNEFVEGASVRARAEFTPAGMAKFNDVVFDMYKAGFLSAVSVGFLPSQWNWSESKERPLGIDFQKQELLEFSCVPVPANPEALIEARAAGVDIAPIKQWAAGVIRSTCGTIRDFEGFLRDVGYSHREAKLLASHGWAGLTQRDVEEKQAAELLTHINILRAR